MVESDLTELASLVNLTEMQGGKILIGDLDGRRFQKKKP